MFVFFLSPFSPLSLSLSFSPVSLSPTPVSLPIFLSLSRYCLSFSPIPVVSLSFSHSCLPFYLSLFLSPLSLSLSQCLPIFLSHHASLSLWLSLCFSVFLPPMPLYLLFSLSPALSHSIDLYPIPVSLSPTPIFLFIFLSL